MRFRRKKESALKNFEQFLKDHNCDFTIKKDGDSTTIPFEYQAGHFFATIRKQDDCLEITFPGIASVPFNQLDLVRAKCNEHNNNNILFKFTYSVDHEANEVNVHLSFFNNMVDADVLKHELNAAFLFQRNWVKSFEEGVEQSKNYDSIDVESELYKHQREMFMLRRLELEHQHNGGVSDIASGTDTLTLWRLLETVAPLPDAKLLFLTVNTVSHQERIQDEEKIRNLDLRRVLVEGEGSEARIIRDYAVIDLHYTQGMDQVPRMATIAVTAEGADGHSLYSRVTVTLPLRNANRSNSLSKGNFQPHCVSMLIALDRNNDQQREQEFKFMWSEAALMIKNNEIDKMSDDQKMLSQVEYADVAYNLYWGQKMFNNERYLEAIYYLENVFESYCREYFEMSPDQKRTYLEVAYKLGFCYNELGLNKLAFYYLDLMGSDGNIRHTMELVNALANGKDLRLFGYTENVLREVKNNFNEEDMPEHIRELVNFLERRRGYAYINFDQLDKAERVFTKMLDDEENADYAINELAYIKKLRELRGETTQEPPAASPDDRGLPF